MFETVIIILNDTAVGRLHIEDFDIPENLQPGDKMVIDPTCMHQVTKAIRSEGRVTCTVIL